MNEKELEQIKQKLQKMGYTEEDFKRVQREYPELTPEEVLIATATMGL